MTPNHKKTAVLQGGGALGAYQAGVLEALIEQNVLLDRVLATSIGAINGALYAGNKPENRVRHLREFWRRVAIHSVQLPFVATPTTSRWQRSQAQLSAMTLGVPAFYGPRAGSAWWDWSQETTASQASFYTHEPLRETLEELVDFAILNSQAVHFSVTAVDIEAATLEVFDNTQQSIHVKHLLASTALPPGFPAVEIDGRMFWDGALYAATPLDLLVRDLGDQDTLCFVVDLWQDEAPPPHSINGVFSRQKEIHYGTRSREALNTLREKYRHKAVLRELMAKVPVDALNAEQLAEYRSLVGTGELQIVHLMLDDDPSMDPIEDPNTDIDFDASSLQQRREMGIADASTALQLSPWKRADRESFAIYTVPPR